MTPEFLPLLVAFGIIVFAAVSSFRSRPKSVAPETQEDEQALAQPLAPPPPDEVFSLEVEFPVQAIDRGMEEGYHVTHLQPVDQK